MTFRWILAALFLALVASPAQRAAADDETDQVEIKVRAPLDATNCVSTPPTVSLLGLTIDIGTASFDANSDCENCGDDEKSEDGAAPVTVTCADLTVGQVVEVKLASDALDPVTGLLVATEVEVGSGDGDGDGEDASIDVAKIEAPLQLVDPNVPSVTVLGLVVDVSHATLDGADDECTDGGRQPVDATQLIVGQIVELRLVSNQAPLAASALEVNNFGNQIDVEVDDRNGNEVDDGSVGDVQVEVDETVVVQAATTHASKHVKTKHVKRKVLLHTTSSGSFTLTGLPTGKAKITVTRGTTSGRKRVVVKANATQQVKIRLR